MCKAVLGVDWGRDPPVVVFCRRKEGRVYVEKLIKELRISKAKKEAMIARVGELIKKGSITFPDEDRAREFIAELKENWP